MIITTIGEVLIDLTQTGVNEGGIVSFAANPGGAPANVAVAASRLGAKTAFIGCVGDDRFGSLLKETLEKNNVDVKGLQITKEANTTLAVVTVDSTGERSFSFCRNPGADTCIDEEKAVSFAKKTDFLHFGSVSLTRAECRLAVLNSVRAAKEAGAVISYDPNYRPAIWESEEKAKEVMRGCLSLCDIVKISDEETVLMSGYEDPAAAAKAIMEKGPSLVLVTLGSKGAYWRYGNAESSVSEGTVPGFKVKVADTNGAGDTFFGAFASRIAEKGSIKALTAEELNEYVRFANRAASLTASRHGAIPAMPTAAEVLSAL